MSYSVDVNVLLYASDETSPRHRAAVAFLRDCSQGGDIFYLAWPVAMSYLRISTHAAIFAAPLSPADALANVRALSGLPHVRLIGEEETFLGIYEEVTSGLPVRGNLVPDAHLAALLRQHGVRTLYTNDADFRKFDFIETKNPFA